jgi:hypothetical protein
LNAPAPSGPTVLRLSGRDALDVIQRISSQQFVDVAPGGARTTLFCDFRGRLLHRAVVARTADGAVWLVRDDARGAELLAYIDRHIFREDVRIEDRSAAWSVWAEWTGDDAPGIEELDGVPVVVPEGRGFRLRLAPAGGAPRLDPGVLERERMTHGRPRHGHEIHVDFNPYEIGCADEVHLSKGCYTGQEALQRLVTYASVRRLPVLVRGRRRPPPVPRDLVSAAGPAGRLTSATPAETPEEWIGIAIVRREVLATATAGAAPPFHLEGGPALDAFTPFPERLPLGRDLTG